MKLAHMKRSGLALTLLVPLMTFGLFGCGQSNATGVAADSNAVTRSKVAVHKAAEKHKLSNLDARPASKQTATVTVSKMSQSGVFPSRVPILEYHDTAYRPHWPWALNPGQFAQEMYFLKTHHFHTITLDQLYDAMKYHTPLPSRPVVITFDDGHVSNFTMAFPILRKYHFVATENMVTKAINRPGYLSAKDLLEMERSGVFEIESHTVDHPYLAKCSTSRIKYELTESKKILTKLLGRPVDFFAYPYGSYDARVIRAVQQAGYKMAVTSNWGYASTNFQGRYTLRRIGIHEGLSIHQFAKWLSPSLAPQKE
ncbi:polysaccharide deacetylase family protein [Alicyclobacillus kakegawensis]|uniref:polysaccharide deacetylase family protein n=1 Tax=Alicyclobacillus kakegawensis TaxID=392012 RepID=UPI00082E5FD6|nr:polysaccharide deacetylase family protein [Alicyclobacillus kakegawensis]